MVEWLEQASQWHGMYCHDLEVMSSNPDWVKLGVYCTSVQSRTWTKNINWWSSKKQNNEQFHIKTCVQVPQGLFYWKLMTQNLPCSLSQINWRIKKENMRRLLLGIFLTTMVVMVHTKSGEHTVMKFWENAMWSIGLLGSIYAVWRKHVIFLCEGHFPVA